MQFPWSFRRDAAVAQREGEERVADEREHRFGEESGVSVYCFGPGMVETPGESAPELWKSLIGADPADPVAFMTDLLGAESGRVAAFYDAIAHTDPAHQAFAIGRAGDRGRLGRAAALMNAVTGAVAAWHVDEQPFLRSDVDLREANFVYGRI